MPATVIRPFREGDRVHVIELWQSCELVRPWNDPHRDIDRKRVDDDSMFLVATNHHHVAGTVMVGYDGHRGWINYLAVAPGLQRLGIGRLLMGRAEQRLHALDCPKINLQIRSDNAVAVQFYERLGYTVDHVVSMGKRLVDDEPVG